MLETSLDFIYTFQSFAVCLYSLALTTIDIVLDSPFRLSSYQLCKKLTEKNEKYLTVLLFFAIILRPIILFPDTKHLPSSFPSREILHFGQK